MGTLLDTTAFVQLERIARSGSRSDSFGALSRRLGETIGELEDVGMAAITASELLHGVHRADAANRVTREAFIEAALAAFPPVPFDLACARAHARLWAHLASAGGDIGAHDRLVAATAMAIGWRVATANVGHFARVPGLEVLELNFAPEG